MEKQEEIQEENRFALTLHVKNGMILRFECGLADWLGRSNIYPHKEITCNRTM